jgi:predicted aspartyl protease
MPAALDACPRFRFLAWVSFAGKRCKVLFDTGADYSLVSGSLATASGLYIDAEASVPALLTATGEAVGVLGTVCGRLNIGCYRIPRQSLIVMADMSEDIDIILGLNWMSEHGCILDMREHCMTLVGQRASKLQVKDGSSKHMVFTKDFFCQLGRHPSQRLRLAHSNLMPSS